MKLQTDLKLRSLFDLLIRSSPALFFFVLALCHFPEPAVAEMLCRQVFTSNARPTERQGALFLHEREPRLQLSPLVERVSQRLYRQNGVRLQKPADRIAEWIRSLENFAHQARTSPRSLYQIKEIFYEHYVIKPGEVPESYFQLQVRLARERGQGNIELSQNQRKDLIDSLTQDQRKSIDSWIDYMVSADSSHYPMWIKYWMFTGMVKLSKFDVETGNFGNRTKETVAPFPELNREALAHVMDLLLKRMDRSALSEIKDASLVQLIEGANFGRLYSHALKSLKGPNAGAFSTNEGRWIIYKKGTDHRALVESLKGQNTGWCTAGDATASGQLQRGDFHVYYSLDQNGQPTRPRVALRMEGNEIAEVRGVGKSQNLDPQITQSTVVSSKMNEFGDRGRSFKIKSEHMRRLTEIDNKFQANKDLGKEDLIFLYEIKETIVGFGQERDPRIAEIRSKRDVKEDMVVAFDGKYRKEEISISSTEFNEKPGIRLHIGNLDYNRKRSGVGLKMPEVLLGNLNLWSLKSAEGLILPVHISGNLILGNLTTAVGLRLPETLIGNLELPRIRSAEGLALPITFSGHLYLSRLRSAAGINWPQGFDPSRYDGPRDF